MSKKSPGAYDQGPLFSSNSWTVSLVGDNNRLEVVNLETKNFSIAWLVDGKLTMSGLTDQHLGHVTDTKELELHRHLASQYVNHLK